ncbi:MAG TPA: uroporphyrinogen decarboxylase family protein [Anaerolineae bacterium]
MTSLQRVVTVLSGGIPDRVPIHLNNFMMNAYALGQPFAAHFQDGAAMAEGHLRAWREFGHDVIIIENGTVALAQACGCEVEYLPDSAPVLIRPVLQSLDDLDTLRMPDSYTVHPLAECLKATRNVAHEVGDQVCVMGRADQGPFSLASMLLGIDTFLMALTDPDSRAKLHQLLAFCLEVVYSYAVAQAEQGAHITSIGESLAGPDVSSPRTYREYEWPYARQLATRLSEKHIPLAYHICGNATLIAADMAETGCAVLELDYKCDLHKIKAAARGKATILGAIDPSGVLALGDAPLIEEKVREEMALLAPGGQFIVGPGCALPTTTPPENIHTLIDAAHRYGRYTSDGQMIRQQ